MRVLYATALVVLSDQLSKLFIKGFSIPWLSIDVKGLPLGTSINVIGDFVRLTYIENAGMAMGIDLGLKAVLSIFSIVAAFGIFFFLYTMRTERLGFRLALALILGGAIGNLIDRVFYGVLYHEAPLLYGKVVDFIDVDFVHIKIFGFQMTRFFVFNVADASVTIGVLLLLFFYRSFGPQRKAGGPESDVLPPVAP
ncbi:MAG: signal peptidase II [Ignavibacteriales bacterium]|nr:signal peptidase II [Ignavibacteriales bacterium]